MSDIERVSRENGGGRSLSGPMEIAAEKSSRRRSGPAFMSGVNETRAGDKRSFQIRNGANGQSMYTYRSCCFQIISHESSVKYPVTVLQDTTISFHVTSPVLQSMIPY